MKILITGGLGFIGSHTAVELSNAGHDCFIIDSLKNSDRDVINRINALSEIPVQFKVVDLLDEKDIREVFTQFKFDAVVHFAGLKAVGESVVKPLQYYEYNLVATLNLLKEMERANVKRIVFSSSATVYGNLTVPPINEAAPISILNPYGRSKLMMEEILKDLVHADPKWNIVLLRYFNPIGAHSSSLLGEQLNAPPNNLMPYVLQVANGHKDYLQVFGGDYPTPDGTGVRDYIHVMDLAYGHVKALEYLKKNRGIETFNLGYGIGHSVLDLIKTFEAVNKVHIPYEIVERRPGDIATSYADISKATKMLSWRPRYDLNQMCVDAWNWMKRQNTGNPRKQVKQ